MKTALQTPSWVVRYLDPQAIGKGGMGAALLVFDPRRSDGGIRVCKVKGPVTG